MTVEITVETPVDNGKVEEGHAEPSFYLKACVTRLVAEWRPILRIQDWDIGIEIGEMLDPNHAAESAWEWRRRVGMIRFPPDFIERSRERRDFALGESNEDVVELSVVHELMHGIEEPVNSMVQSEIDYWVGDGTKCGVIGAELRNQWRDYREWWINHMAKILVSHKKGLL